MDISLRTVGKTFASTSVETFVETSVKKSFEFFEENTVKTPIGRLIILKMKINSPNVHPRQIKKTSFPWKQQ